MKILWQGFAALNHSWSIVAQNICRELIKLGHDVDIYSTNGNLYFPKDLLSNLIGYNKERDIKNIIGNFPSGKYDMQLSYTALKNFEYYFSHGNKNRFGIWNYETTILPKSFAKYYKYVDKVLPSSEFSKTIFTNNGIPAENQVVIPHGIHLDRFQTLGKYSLKTNKKYKILVNIAQPHLRKNIPGMLKAFGLAFTKKDDVCLVLKISRKGPNPQFDIPFNQIYADWEKKFKDHAEVELIDRFIPDIEPLYNACDIGFTMTHCECFYMPALENFAANKVTIAPRYGGQLDFMNDDNSILIGGKKIRADFKMQYWEPSPYAECFEPDVNEAAEKLKDVVANYNNYLTKFSPKMKEVVLNHSWLNVAKSILKLCV